MDKKIPLMLDSTVFKQVPKLNSWLFKELVKYTRADIYNLYISEIVEQEFISWIKAEAQNAFDTVTKATKSLNKYYEEPSFLCFNLDFNATVFAAENQINGILKKVVENWGAFKEKTNATVIPIRQDHGKLVMDAYFKGEKPFSKIKNRSDIPDAFIYCSLKDLQENNDKVIFVSSDKKFSQIIQNKKLICFENLSDLFSKGPSKLDAQFFNSLDDKNRVFTLVNIFEDEIRRKLVWEIELSLITDDIVQKFIDIVIGEFKDVLISVLYLKIHINEIKNISELSFLVPFAAKVNYFVESIAAKDELTMLNDDRLKNIDKEVDDNGDFRLSERHHNSVIGHFSLNFDETDPSTWKEQKKSNSFLPEHEVTEISVTLEDIQKDA